MKKLTRHGRGQGQKILFEDDSPSPSKFNNRSLQNNCHKVRLNLFLADKFYSFQQDNKTFTITKEFSVFKISKFDYVIIFL